MQTKFLWFGLVVAFTGSVAAAVELVEEKENIITLNPLDGSSLWIVTNPNGGTSFQYRDKSGKVIRKVDCSDREKSCPKVQTAKAASNPEG